MASEWSSVLLGNIARFKAGSAFKPEHQGISSGELPFIKVSDLNLPGNEHAMRVANNWISRDLAKEIKASLHPAGATVFAKIGVALTYNRRRLLLQDTAIDNNMMSAAPDESVIRSRYLYFLLKNLDFNEVANGSALPYLNVRDLKSIPVEVPDLRRQDEILEILGSIEDRLDCLSDTNATLEAIAQALFKSWFVDFDPVRAKAEGREPEGMDAATAALFPSEFEDSELGVLPQGWKYAPLADSISVQVGGAWGEESTSAKSTVEVSCLRGIDAVEIGAGKKPSVPRRWVSPKQIASRVLVDGDVLVEGSGSFCGRSLYWIDSYAELVSLTPTYSNFVKRLSSPHGPEVSLWVSRHLMLIYESGEIVNYRTGSAFPNLDMGGLLSRTVATPGDARVAAAFHDLIRPLLESKAQNIVRSATLEGIRDTLLPRLISGKLRLPEAASIADYAIAS